MHYHIGNMLIHQEFQSGKSCPLCRIRNILENSWRSSTSTMPSWRTTSAKK